MIDREKVKQGIKACWSEYFSHKCCDCPYMSDRNERKCVERLGADAIALLKEQEAVKRTCRKGINGFSIIWTCGACGSDLHPNNAKAKYCSNCGKPILWEGR